jgi:hypothetical protein
MERDEIYTLIRKARPALADSSVRTYTSNVVRANRELGTNAFDENSARIVKVFADKSKAVQKSVVVACLVWARASKKPHDNLVALLKELDGAVRKQVISQQPSKKERDNWVSMAKLRKMVQRMREDIRNRKLLTVDPLPPRGRALIQACVILGFMLKGPLRLDLADLRFVTAYKYKRLGDNVRTSWNWLVKGSGNNMNLYLFRFKTAKHFTDLPISVPIDTKDKAAFNKWLKVRERLKFEHDWVFVNQGGGKLSRSSLSKLISGYTRLYTGKTVGASLLRHIFITNWLGDERALKQKLDMARRTGQTNIFTQATYRRI